MFCTLPPTQWRGLDGPACTQPCMSDCGQFPSEAVTMICVTIARASHRMALAGLVNAAHMGADLVEVRLDTFDRAPDLDELIAAKRTPVMFSCRRVEDGGHWSKSEEERLELLRQAVLA